MEIYTDEAIGEDFDGGSLGSDGPILPPSMEMEPKEGFTLMEWRRYAFEFHFVSLIGERSGQWLSAAVTRDDLISERSDGLMI